MNTHKDTASRYGFLALGGLLLALSCTANATIVSYNFSGTVNELTANDGLFGLGASVGDSFTGHFTYDTGPGNPDQAPGDPDAGIYSAMEFIVDTTVLPMTPLTPFAISIALVEPETICIAPNPCNPGYDRLSIYATSLAYDSIISLTLKAPHGTLPNDALPETLNLADFTLQATVTGVDAIGIDGNQTIWDWGTLDTLTLEQDGDPGGGGGGGGTGRIPEPGSLALLGLGLSGLAAIRRRRHL